MMKDGQLSFAIIEPSLKGSELVVPHLQPYTNYTFKVSARNVVGLGQSSQVTNTTLQDGKKYYITSFMRP